MKKLGKLNINPDKILKNEELLILRGGYDLPWVQCVDEDHWPGTCGCYVPNCDDEWIQTCCQIACPGSEYAYCL